MNKKPSTQKSSQKNSSSTSKRVRKTNEEQQTKNEQVTSNLEMVENQVVDKTTLDIEAFATKMSEPVVAEPVVKNFIQPVSTSRWIRDTINATKTCEACGSVMRGWAYRETFNFCPKCGKRTAQN